VLDHAVLMIIPGYCTGYKGAGVRYKVGTEEIFIMVSNRLK